MKVLAYSCYYTPEIAASMYLTEDIYKGIVDAGHTLEVYVPMPTRGISEEVREKYKKKKVEKKYGGKMIIHRISMYREGKNNILRAMRYLFINVAFIWKGLRTKADVIFVQSTPPTQGMMAAIIGKIKKIPVVYNLQDIFPDSLANSGITHKGSLLWKIGRKIEDYSYRNSQKIIVISKSFEENILAKGADKHKISVISNWVDTSIIRHIEKKDNSLFHSMKLSNDDFIVVYAGNFGAAQGAEIILRVAEKLKPNNQIKFVIFGGGAYFEAAKKEVSEKNLYNVMIQPLMPPEMISEVYSLGDIALITCKPGFGNAGMPSKTWSIMACNTPIIASFDLDSDLANIINLSQFGCCVEPGNEDKLADAIQKAFESKNSLFVNRSMEYLYKNASKESCVGKYVDIITGFGNM